MTPLSASSRRASPGRIGSPAASAEVQRSGRQGVRAQVPGRAAVGGPAGAGALGGEQLEQLAVALAQREHVTVAAALDRRVGRDRVRPGVGLVRHVEADGDERLRERDAHIGDAVGAGAAEVRPQGHRAERADVVVRGVDGEVRHVGVPRVALGEHRAAADRRAAGEGVAAPTTAGPGPGRDARRARPHRHAPHLRAALAPARAHRVAVARRRLDLAVGESLAVALEPHRAALALHDVARLAARAVAPRELDGRGARPGLQLADGTQLRAGGGRREQEEDDECGEGAHPHILPHAAARIRGR